MITSNNLLSKSAEVCTLCLFLHPFLCPVAWNAADASDLRMRATISKVESELEELKFSRIALIRAAIPPLKCETPDFYMRKIHFSSISQVFKTAILSFLVPGSRS